MSNCSDTIFLEEKGGRGKAPLAAINNPAASSGVCCLGKVSDSGFNTQDSAASRGVLNPSQTIKGRRLMDLPQEDRPREKLLKKGPSALSDMELLAILLNTGIRGKNVKMLADELLELLDKNNDIPSIKELSSIPGLGLSKASAVAAMLEFGRRRYGSLSVCIKQPSDIFTLVRHYADRKQERFISLSLNGAHEVLAVRVVTIGLVNRTIVHPREVFADLIQDRAAAFCVAHNHPSGQLCSSVEDEEVTARLQEAAAILGIQFIDHLVFSETDWWSFRQNGKMNGVKTL